MGNELWTSFLFSEKRLEPTEEYHNTRKGHSVCNARQDHSSRARVDSRPAVVLFLHGSGDSGPGFRQTLNTICPVEQLIPPNSVLLFPTAQKRPYTPMMAHLSNVWFDRPRLHYEAVEDSATLQQSILSLENTLKDAATSCSARDPLIFLVGFSMGGSMALHLAFHLIRKDFPVHGVFVHSSFIGKHSKAIPEVDTDISITTKSGLGVAELQLLFVHGSHDTMVPCEWGRLTAKRLRESGYNVHYKQIEGLRHEISAESLGFMEDFIRSVFSES